MTVSIASAVARKNSTGSLHTLTTASFNTAVGDLLLICANGDDDGLSGDATWGITDNQGSHLTYTEIVRRNASSAVHGSSIAWRATPGAITGLTITVTASRTSFYVDSIKVYKATGHDTTTPIGATNNNESTTNNLTTGGITSQTDGGASLAVGTDWTAAGDPVSSDLTVDSYTLSGLTSGTSGFKTISLNGQTVTGNLDAGGTAAVQWTYVEFEVRAALPPGQFPAYFVKDGGYA
jgi:hypothetical protein